MASPLDPLAAVQRSQIEWLIALRFQYPVEYERQNLLRGVPVWFRVQYADYPDFDIPLMPEPVQIWVNQQLPQTPEVSLQASRVWGWSHIAECLARHQLLDVGSWQQWYMGYLRMSMLVGSTLHEQQPETDLTLFGQTKPGHEWASWQRHYAGPKPQLALAIRQARIRRILARPH